MGLSIFLTGLVGALFFWFLTWLIDDTKEAGLKLCVLVLFMISLVVMPVGLLIWIWG